MLATRTILATLWLALYVAFCSTFSPNLTSFWRYSNCNRRGTSHKEGVLGWGGNFNETSQGTILQNQVYVEQVTRAGGVSQPKSLMVLYGGDLSAELWLNKTDGGRFWASYFLGREYQVYVVDAWDVGRQVQGLTNR